MKTFLRHIIALFLLTSPVFSDTAPLRFVVISDIHIYSSGRVPEKAPAVIDHIVKLEPDMVFITGDHTNGNRDDKVTLSKVRSWYKSLDSLLTPLLEKEIPVIPIVGNHDFYRAPHKQGYTEWAKKTLHKSFNKLGVKPPINPLFF